MVENISINRPTLASLLPQRTDRAILVGQTGSGKTTLAKAILAQRKYVVIFDAKGLIDWTGYRRYTSLKMAVESEHERILYAPNHTELRDEEYWDGFFEWIYTRQNCTVYIDEVFSICKRENIPPFYHACLTRGRERKIEVFSSTQRPRSIPSVIKSESENWYVFRLQLPQDRKAVRDTIGIREEEIEKLPEHHFYFAKDTGVRRGPLKLSIRKIVDGKSTT